MAKCALVPRFTGFGVKSTEDTANAFSASPQSSQSSACATHRHTIANVASRRMLCDMAQLCNPQ